MASYKQLPSSGSISPGEGSIVLGLGGRKLYSSRTEPRGSMDDSMASLDKTHYRVSQGGR